MRRFELDKNIILELPSKYTIKQEIDEEGELSTSIESGEYMNDDGMQCCEFQGNISYHTIDPDDYDEIINSNNLLEVVARSRELDNILKLPVKPEILLGNREMSISVLGSTLDIFMLAMLIKATDNSFVLLVTSKTSEDDSRSDDVFYDSIVEIAESIRIFGKKVSLECVSPHKLEQHFESRGRDNIFEYDFLNDYVFGNREQEEQEETSYTINSDGNITSSDGDEFSSYDSDEETEVSLFDLLKAFGNYDEVAFSDEDSREVVVDNNWSFRLPTGTNLRFDAEHLDIMGNYSEARYVVLGLNHNGRDYFDFELHERFDYDMSTDLDVSGCRYDDDVISGDAQQHTILNGDDLYVDVVNKPIFFARSMIMIRVRGEDLNPWDFVMGVDGWDDDQNAVWNEVKSLIFDMAGSIKLIDPSDKSIKKFIDNNDIVYKDEESELEWEAEATDNWMEKYSEHLEDNPTIVFEGKKFVTSGIYGDEEKNIKQKISECGGINRTQVSGVTDYLIVKPYSVGESKICSAIEQAKKGKGIKIILLEDLEKAIEDNVYRKELPVE